MEGVMKIIESAILQQSSYNYSEKRISERTVVIQSSQDLNNADNRKSNSQKSVRDNLQMRQEKEPELKLYKRRVQSRRLSGVQSSDGEDNRLLSDLNILILKKMIERITGKKIEVIYSDDFEVPATEPDKFISTEKQRDVSQVSQVNDNGQLQRISVRTYEYYAEEETTAYSSKGMVKTGDGKEIEIDINMYMHRSFETSMETKVNMERIKKDPLVLNFKGDSDMLGKKEFNFDIDMDGEPDQLRQLAAGNGFLVLDKNNDNTINDGSEMFGAQTGNGFKELSEYDEDGNGWIDENDSIYNKLRIWLMNGDNRELVALAEKGVGAIYLGQAETPYQIKSNGDAADAEIRATGLYLNEDGSAGLLHQIDYLV